MLRALAEFTKEGCKREIQPHVLYVTFSVWGYTETRTFTLH